MANPDFVAFSRKDIMEYFHEHSDRNGKVLITQYAAAMDMGIDYKTVSRAVRELVHVGYMTSYGGNRKGMHILHHPDDCDFGPEFDRIVESYRKQKKVRSK